MSMNVGLFVDIFFGGFLIILFFAALFTILQTPYRHFKELHQFQSKMEMEAQRKAEREMAMETAMNSFIRQLLSRGSKLDTKGGNDAFDISDIPEWSMNNGTNDGYQQQMLLANSAAAAPKQNSKKTGYIIGFLSGLSISLIIAVIVLITKG